MEGSVFLADDSVRINVQLIRAQPEEHLWAGDYYGELRNALVLQGEAARAIARAIGATIKPEVQARPVNRRSVDPEAQEVYLKGLYLLEQLANTGVTTLAPGACSHAPARLPLGRRWHMTNRAGDWLAQAERDLEQAEASRAEGRHEWACFAAHQSAEKALKALHLQNGQEAWGHVVARLVEQLPVEYDPILVDKAKVLDSFYVPTRYPNGHPDGAPFEHYGGLQSDEAIRYAGEILDFVRAQMA